jgi:excisionase family DNA binding protein
MDTILQAATYLGVSCPTLRRWDRSRKLTPFRTSGNHRKYSKGQFKRFLGLYENEEETPILNPQEFPLFMLGSPNLYNIKKAIFFLY